MYASADSMAGLEGLVGMGNLRTGLIVDVRDGDLAVVACALPFCTICGRVGTEGYHGVVECVD